MSLRTELLDLLSGKKIDRKPVFSGLIHATLDGLESEGLVFHEIHKDANQMAKAAASTFRLTGMPSAALPLDLCAPAEALGAVLNYYEQRDDQFPQPAKPLFRSATYLNKSYFESANFISKGRIPLICEALQLLKEDIGEEVVISGIIPGPYTLLLYLIEPGGLFAEMKREPNVVQEALFHLCSFLAQVGNAYIRAGADFITIHDMGGSPGFIGPAKYEQFAFPAEKQLIADLPKTCVLSVCGNTNKSLQLLAQTGADAISVDQVTHLPTAREALKDTLLFGNLDPVITLYRGDEIDIKEAVRESKKARVDAVWPGCDLVPSMPIQNIKTMMAIH